MMLLDLVNECSSHTADAAARSRRTTVRHIHRSYISATQFTNIYIDQDDVLIKLNRTASRERITLI
jgi:hypothetical protein